MAQGVAMPPMTFGPPGALYGTGVDIVEIVRIQEALERHGQRFVERILGPAEQQRFSYRKEKNAARGLAYLATRFAAKEAIAKAVGLGLHWPMTWRAAEVLNAPDGRPVVVVHEALAAYVAERELELLVSISDERAYAVAWAVAQRRAVSTNSASSAQASGAR